MYNWRRMTPEAREDVLRLRQQSGQPWHGPPHGIESHWYHFSAACYEHNPILGFNPDRMARFERDLVAALAPVCIAVSVWCVLPNHYHVLAQSIDLAGCRHALGHLHGRCSHD